MKTGGGMRVGLDDDTRGKLWLACAACEVRIEVRLAFSAGPRHS
jgi:hypothetical protein